MELWIRSQDGRKLVIAKDFIVDEGNFIVVNGIRMGYYKTEKRAIEILDDIDKLLDGEYDFEMYRLPQE